MTAEIDFAVVRPTRRPKVLPDKGLTRFGEMQGICVAVIEQAMADLRSAAHQQPNAQNRHYSRESAIETERFLMDQTGPWAESREIMCDAAGICPDALRRWALRHRVTVAG